MDSRRKCSSLSLFEDVPDNVVVAGSPAKIIKSVDDKTKDKTQLLDDLRK